VRRLWLTGLPEPRVSLLTSTPQPPVSTRNLEPGTRANTQAVGRVKTCEHAGLACFTSRSTTSICSVSESIIVPRRPFRRWPPFDRLGRGRRRRCHCGKTRPCATTGPEKPLPTFARQRTSSPEAGMASMMPVSRHTPSRFGPRHCGQSSARTARNDSNDKLNASV
jgi:hypothetical protein